jgi:hypothetical protein
MHAAIFYKRLWVLPTCLTVNILMFCVRLILELLGGGRMISGYDNRRSNSAAVEADSTNKQSRTGLAFSVQRFIALILLGPAVRDCRQRVGTR